MTTDNRQLAFGNTLRLLREQAGLKTGREFAQRVGWLPSKVSRIETGVTVPTDSDVITYLTVCFAPNDPPEDLVEDLRNELREIRLARSSWKRRLRSGHTPEQRHFAEMERAAKHVVMVDFFIIPGLAQTADYARAVFEAAAELHLSPQDTDAAVRARIRRQDVLDDSAKRIDLLIAESALRYPAASQPVMIAQIDRLLRLASLPNVRVGVIPLDTRLPIMTMHGYMMLDDVAIVEINHTELTVTDIDDVALYQRLTEQLWSAAAEGDQARVLLARVAADLVG